VRKFFVFFRNPFFWIFCSGLVLFAPFVFQPIQLAIQDYGRHVQNGRLVLAGHFEILHTNYYSFAHADFPVVNHHWLIGVLFALGEQLGGARLTHIVHSLALFAVLALFLLRGRQEGLSPGWLFFITILGVMFFSQRVEVRPETVGYLGVAGLILWLRGVERGTRQVGWLSICWWTLVSVFWVNAHVSFFFGYGLVWWTVFGAFCSRRWPAWSGLGFLPVSSANLKRLCLLAVCMTSVTLINPNGVLGALQPFLMFQNYGYAVSENMTPFYLWNLLPNPIHKIWLVSLITGAVAVSLGWRRLGLLEAVRIAGVMAFSVTAVRHFPFFALLALPGVVVVLQAGYRSLQCSTETKQNLRLLGWSAVGSAFAVAVVLTGVGRFFSNGGWSGMGVGMAPDQFGSAEFVRTHALRGIAFNNYDIGSYLISQVWPNVQPLTDNRPEAYPKDFFNKDYIPQQFDRGLWDTYSKEKGIDIVFFGHNDVTSWAKAFLNQLWVNPEWALVYKDNLVVIFLRRNEKYRDLIARFDQSPPPQVTQKN